MDTTTKTTQKVHHGFLAVQFSEINLPGVYITQRGDMFRVPNEALAEGRSPVLAWENREGGLVSRICEDPYTPISKCRQLAADADLTVNFLGPFLTARRVAPHCGGALPAGIAWPVSPVGD